MTDLAPGSDKLWQEKAPSLDGRLAEAERDVHATIVRLETSLAVKSRALQQMTTLVRKAQMLMVVGHANPQFPTVRFECIAVAA